MIMRLLPLTLLMAASAVATAQYDFYTSTTFTGAVAVSDTGAAVGPSGSGHGIWKPRVNATPVAIGGNSSSGRQGISANGLWIGGSAPGPDTKIEIGRYSVASGTWTTFGGAGGYSGTTRSSCWGISGDGSMVFGYGYGTYTGTGSGTFTGIRPITIQNGNTVDLSQISNANSINRITGASFDGSVVAGRMRETSSTDGVYYWRNLVRTSMYATGTTYLGEPGAVSGDGNLVGGNGNSATGLLVGTLTTWRPYVFDTNTNTYELIATVAGENGNVVPGTATRIDGFVTGITRDGNTAVGFFQVRAPVPTIDKAWGFIWRRGQGVQNIDQWAADNSIAGAATYYLVPMAISPDGKTITGWTIPRTGTYTAGGFMIAGPPHAGADAYTVNFGIETAVPGVRALIKDDGISVQLCQNLDQEDPAPAQLEVTGYFSGSAPSSLTLDVRAKAESNDREIFVEFYNYVINDWVGQPSLPVTDSFALYSINAPGTAADCVRSSDGQVLARITGLLGAADQPTVPCYDFDQVSWR